MVPWKKWRKQPVDLGNLRDGEESVVSVFVLPGLRSLPHRTLSAGGSHRRAVGFFSRVSLKGYSSYHWADSKSDCRAIHRVLHNLSSIHGRLWEWAGTLLINMPEQQAWTRTAPGKPNHTGTPEMTCNSKHFLPRVSNHFISALSNLTSV